MNCDLCGRDRTPAIRVDEFVLCPDCASHENLATMLQEKRHDRNADVPSEELGTSA